MPIIPSLLFLGLFFILGVIFYKKIIRPFFLRRELHAWFESEKIQKPFQVLNQAYQGIDGGSLAVADRKTYHLEAWEYTYGEIPFVTLAAIFETIELPAGGVFYDLGSGTGKTVIAAALLHDFSRSVGIEQMPSLHECALACLKKVNASTELPAHFSDCDIKLLHSDFLLTDFFDASVVFLNATGLFGDVWDQLVLRLNQLNPGTIVIITTKQLDPAIFELMDARLRVMSWGMNRTFIYKRRDS